MISGKRLAFMLVGACTALLICAAPIVASAKDANHDKIPDKWEAKYHLSTKKNVAHKNPDKDGLTNIQEYLARTNPLKKDSDSDGVSDANEDPDGDRLTNAAEFLCGTNPLVADSDGDGSSDFNEDADQDGLENGAEIAVGYNPQNEDSDGDGTIDSQEVMGYVTSFDSDTGAVTLLALDDSRDTVTVYVNNDTTYAWGDTEASDDAPSADDLQVGALVTRVEGADGDDGSVAASAITIDSTAAMDDLVATVQTFDEATGIMTVVPTDGGDEYDVRITHDTKFAWADGIYGAHRPGKGTLAEGIGFTVLEIEHDSSGNAVATKLALVPDFVGAAPGDGDAGGVDADD